MTARTTIAVVLGMLAAASEAMAYRNALWIPPWNANALTSIQTNLGLLTESNPVWYNLNSDGGVVRNHANAENDTWRAAMTGTLILPTIQNVVDGSFSGAAIAGFISTPAGREAHAEGIAQLVMTKAYDGIDLDYEAVPAASRADFTAFLAALAGKLHAAGKLLSVTVYAKTSDAPTWAGPGAEDWPAIGQIADSVKIMCYDYHWSTSDPGPLAPLDWIDAVATYAQKTIPNDKITIGLPWYGYNWSRSSSRASSVTYASATQLAQTNNATIARDVNQEATFTYGDHTVFFQDATSYRAKVDVVRQKHAAVAGFTAWSAGVEDPAIWDVIRETSVEMSVSGPESIVVMQGRSASSDYKLSGNATAAVSIASGPFGSLDRSTVRPGESVRLTVDTTEATVPGTYAIVLRFEAGTMVRDVTVTVSVLPAARRRAVNK